MIKVNDKKWSLLFYIATRKKSNTYVLRDLLDAFKIVSDLFIM